MKCTATNLKPTSKLPVAFQVLVPVQVLLVPRPGMVWAEAGNVIAFPLIWKVEVKLAVPLQVLVPPQV